MAKDIDRALVEKFMVDTDMSAEEVKSKYGIYYGEGYCYAGNRGEHAEFLRIVEKMESKRAYEETVASGYATWKKHGGEWRVLVSGGELKPETVLKVLRKDKTAQDKVVVGTVGSVAEGYLYEVKDVEREDVTPQAKTAKYGEFKYVCEECGAGFFQGRVCPVCGEDTMIKEL